MRAAENQTMPESAVRIMIVDDEAVVRRSLGGWLAEEGYHVDTAASGKEALEALGRDDWDIFLLDIKMPGIDGLELQRRIQENHAEATIIIMTAYASVDTAVEAMKQGAYDYIVKPFDPEALGNLVRKAAERKRILAENVQLRQKIEELSPFQGIVGQSPAIQRVLEEVQIVASSDTNVLVRGESGTGKELIARAIHACSPRRFLPIVAVSCGALSEGVLESELFGHEKGAFTGAQYRRKGKFELADGGTLFLDEIGDITLKTQVDLLRVLEEKQVCRVGGNKMISVDFRLIAATNRNLENMVKDGDFREDLYYRLNVFAITIPPLRERREDIPLLAGHFLQKFARSMNKHVTGISEEALRLLNSYDWPGNIRELQNSIERAFLVAKSETLQPTDFPMVGSPPAAVIRDEKSLAAVERDHILAVLDETGWNISHSARLLQIDRVTLYNKIRKYDLKREDQGPASAESR
jgi:two-component system, NtrC family, response regulator HydG